MSDSGSTNEREILEEQLDFLLDSLRDLERERAAGDIDEPDYEAFATTTSHARQQSRTN